MSDALCSRSGEESNTEWENHPKYKGIRIGRSGRVQSRWAKHHPRGKRGGTVTILGTEWHEMKPQPLPSGYQFITINGPATGTGKKRNRYIHQLVLETFEGPCPEGQEALHSDGNRSNNALSNLRWGTRSENMADADRHGTLCRGSRHGIAKLTEEQVVEIIQLLMDRQKPSVVAERFQISVATLHSIRSGKGWSHVPRPGPIPRLRRKRVGSQLRSVTYP